MDKNMNGKFKFLSLSDELDVYTRTSAGSEPIDFLLNGGFENKTLTTIYGPAGSGKTNIVLLASKYILEKGKKVIFIDTENSFSIERFKQIGGLTKNFNDKFLLLKPLDFNEQKEIVLHLKDIVDGDFGLIVVDSISMLYRLKMGITSDIFLLNKEFSVQISNLIDLAQKFNIPVVVTNQVYVDFDNKNINMVGGDLLRYSSKCLVELKLGKNGIRAAIVKKHRSINEGKTVFFKIVENGLELVKE